MLCPLCHGHRLFYVHGQLLPCPECEGQGEIHCCDGLQEQPPEREQDVTSESGTDKVIEATKEKKLDKSDSSSS